MICSNKNIKKSIFNLLNEVFLYVRKTQVNKKFTMVHN